MVHLFIFRLIKNTSLFAIDLLKILTSFVYIIIQILDVDRMLAKSATPAEIIAMETPQQAMENHPVIRTLYDHIDVSASFTRC